MTYDARETSLDSGEPIELFKFVAGGQTFTYTSCDQEQVLASDTYTPAAIHRSAVELDGETTKGAIEISVPRTIPLAALFVGYAPEPAVTVTVIQLHRGEAEQVQSTWEIGTARYTGSIVTFTCVPADSSLQRQIPRNCFKTQCNWALYSAQCGINKDLFKVVGTVVVIGAGTPTIQASAFSSKPDGWLNNGWVERDNGERRWIVNHVGATLTLMSPFLNLAVNEVVTAFAGCDRLETTCDVKFGNLVNHFGFARVPTRNPFKQGIRAILAPGGDG